jgi:two-component system, NarL family, invasion response regulator UvrY
MKNLIMKNILLISELPVVQKSIIDAFKDVSDYKMTTFPTINDLPTFEQLNNYDLVFFNTIMLEEKIIDILKNIKVRFPDLPLILYTLTHSDQLAIRALKVGISGYLCFNSSIDEFAKAIEKVLSGGLYIPLILAEYLALNLKRNGERKLHDALTNREFQVMNMIATGKSIGEIATELYISKNTISNHRTHILKKLKLKNNYEITMYAYKNKLLTAN